MSTYIPQKDIRWTLTDGEGPQTNVDLPDTVPTAGYQVTTDGVNDTLTVLSTLLLAAQTVLPAGTDVSNDYDLGIGALTVDPWIIIENSPYRASVGAYITDPKGRAVYQLRMSADWGHVTYA